MTMFFCWILVWINQSLVLTLRELLHFQVLRLSRGNLHALKTAGEYLCRSWTWQGNSLREIREKNQAMTENPIHMSMLVRLMPGSQQDASKQDVGSGETWSRSVTCSLRASIRLWQAFIATWCFMWFCTVADGSNSSKNTILPTLHLKEVSFCLLSF